MNPGPSTAPGCELPLPDGRLCGIQAIGRCTTCWRAFCTTHQANREDVFHNLIPYIDLCVACSSAKHAAEATQQAQAWAASPMRYLLEGDAKTALVTAGVPTVEIYDVTKRWEPNKGFLAHGGQDVEVFTPLGRGWMIGEFQWVYTISKGAYLDPEAATGTFPTALVDDRKAAYVGAGHPLIRVRLHARGFERLAGGFVDGQWEAVVQAVKRLTDDPSEQK